MVTGAAPVIQDADASQATNGPLPTAHGRARVCATKDIAFDSYREIKLPATTVFRDSGSFKGDVRDPWTPEPNLKDNRWAAFITSDPVTLTKAKPCAESGVRMLIAKSYDRPSASASEHRIWDIEDALDYPPPSGRPPIEIGKLVDDISVRAELLSDVGDPLTLAKEEAGEATQALKCLEGAQKVASHERGVIGRQTSSVVFISHPAASEFSYGCGDFVMGPDVFILWNKARPAPSTIKLIMSAGAFLTGAPAEEMKQELAKCVSEALKPDAGEISSREFGGAKIECQAFERDGGGGSATVWRRFGAYPVHDMPGEKVLSDMKRASAALATVEDAEAAKSVEFAKWWLDETIPTKVKTFMMIAARVQALAYRCPTWKPDYTVIAKAAAFADLSVQDIQPGGKYFDTFASMMVGMRKGVEEESRQEACQTAKKNYGEARNN